MSDSVSEPAGPGDSGRAVSRRIRLLLVGAGTVCLLAVLFWVLFWRPTVRLNRFFSSVGLARLPSSARDLCIERQGRVWGAHVLYARFEASVDEIARFVDGSPMTTGNEPTAMATIAFGPRCPTWMTWERTVEGRTYHDEVDGASVWLMVDDESHRVYVGVFQYRPVWLRRFTN
jgi:hypothetical protein